MKSGTCDSETSIPGFTSTSPSTFHLAVYLKSSTDPNLSSYIASLQDATRSSSHSDDLCASVHCLGRDSGVGGPGLWKAGKSKSVGSVQFDPIIFLKLFVEKQRHLRFSTETDESLFFPHGQADQLWRAGCCGNGC